MCFVYLTLTVRDWHAAQPQLRGPFPACNSCTRSRMRFMPNTITGTMTHAIARVLSRYLLLSMFSNEVDLAIYFQ